MVRPAYHHDSRRGGEPLSPKPLSDLLPTRLRIFHPDQVAPPYSDRRQDIWFGITHEVNGRVASGLTDAVANPEWCVVLCEEFAAPKGKMVYGALLGPERRKGKLQRSTIQSMSPKLEQRIMAAYQQITASGKLAVVWI
jgi:hypothetical protein